MNILNTDKSTFPDWARDAIWYQIFPERFRNGCPASNPHRDDIENNVTENWHITHWGKDWYALDEWEKPLGFKTSVFYRRYGGDLVGVYNKLDYLHELGVTALYLNPIFMSRSLHKYDAMCLHHIDPTLGPDRDGDLKKLCDAGETDDPESWIWTAADHFFIELVEEVHRRNMRIIIDGVFNHVGTDFFAFKDMCKHGQQSRYKDWFRIKKWQDDGSFEYDGWNGVRDMPEFNRTETTLVKPVRDYLYHITKRWMDPGNDGDLRKGVDGWRLDVADCVPHVFWKEWRKQVKAIRADAYITGEIVTTAEEYLQGDEFDAVMNYAWLFPVLGFFSPSDNPLSRELLIQQLDRLKALYGEETNGILMNLFDSHDTGRILSMIKNRAPIFFDWEAYFIYAKAFDNPKLDSTIPGPESLQILKQMVMFQMTFPGSPMIYYGTEVGMWGANDPCDRQPMLWDDMSYDNESCTLDGSCPTSIREPNHELLAFFKKVIALRQQTEVLRRGGFRWVDVECQRVVVFERFDEDVVCRCVFNASDESVVIPVQASTKNVWNDDVVKSGTVVISPRGWGVFKG